MKKFAAILAFAVVTGITLPPLPAQGQCSMCRAVAESGASDQNQKVGQGLNSGILYLLAMPYLIGGVAFGIWWKHRKSSQGG